MQCRFFCRQFPIERKRKYVMIRKEVSGENGGEMFSAYFLIWPCGRSKAVWIYPKLFLLYIYSLIGDCYVVPLNVFFFSVSDCQVHQYTSRPSPTWLTVVLVRRWVSLTFLPESRAFPTTPRIPWATAEPVGQGWVKLHLSLWYVSVWVRRIFQFKMNIPFVSIRSIRRFSLRMRALSWRWMSWTSTSAWPPWLPCSATCRETTSPLKLKKYETLSPDLQC